MTITQSIGARRWSGIGRWTILATICCVVFSVTVNLMMFGRFGPEVAKRVMFSAALMPILIGTPFFIYFSLRIRRLTIANMRLGRVARTDSLTACLNRGAFTTRVDDWLTAGHTASGALLMIDADNFKSINDLYGHDCGDEALTLIARAIRSALRNGDLVGRMGGEEFAVFLPGATERQAMQVAERIRNAVSASQFAPDGRLRGLSVSIGGAVFTRPSSFSELFRLADQKLYGAKHAGRNTSTVELVERPPVLEIRKSA